MELILHTEDLTTRDHQTQRKLCLNASVAKKGRNFPFYLSFITNSKEIVLK